MNELNMFNPFVLFGPIRDQQIESSSNVKSQIIYSSELLTLPQKDILPNFAMHVIKTCDKNSHI